jgi:hypothetical protein
MYFIFGSLAQLHLIALDMNLFEQQDWSYLPYGCEGLAEELPNNMPKP